MALTVAALQAILDENKAVSRGDTTKYPMVAAIKELMASPDLSKAFYLFENEGFSDGMGCLQLLYSSGWLNLASAFLELDAGDLKFVRYVLTSANDGVIMGGKVTVINVLRMLKSRDKPANIKALTETIQFIKKQDGLAPRYFIMVFDNLKYIQQINAGLAQLGSLELFDKIMIEPKYAVELARAAQLAKGFDYFNEVPFEHPQYADRIANGFRELFSLRNLWILSTDRPWFDTIFGYWTRATLNEMINTYPQSAHHFAHCVALANKHAGIGTKESREHTEQMIALLSDTLKGKVESTSFFTTQNGIPHLLDMNCDPSWYILANIYHGKVELTGVKKDLDKAEQYYRFITDKESPCYNHAQAGLFDILLGQVDLSNHEVDDDGQMLRNEFKKIGEYLVDQGYQGVNLELLKGAQGETKELFADKPLWLNLYQDPGVLHESKPGGKSFRSVGVGTPDYW